MVWLSVFGCCPSQAEGTAAAFPPPGGRALLTSLPSEKEFHSLTALLPQAAPWDLGYSCSVPIPRGSLCLHPCTSTTLSTSLHAASHYLLPQRAHSGSPTVLTQLKCPKKQVLAVLLWACCAPSRDTTLGRPYHRVCVQPSFSFSPWEAEKSEF